MKLSKVVRDRIAREFASRNGGVFDPAAFVREVQASGPKHEAWGWFTDGVEAAANKCWVAEARDFVRDLRIQVIVQEPRDVTVKVRAEYPAFFSPLGGRMNGGGYKQTDPDNTDHIRELAKQAARDLESWMNRYRAVLDRCAIDIQPLDKVIGRLEIMSPEAAE